MGIGSTDILFVGYNNPAVAWHRTGMPAFYSGCDWVNLAGQMPDVQVWTALKRGGSTMPVWSNYKVIVFQQPFGNGWLNHIRSLQHQGIICLYEVDDYLHGVAKTPGHAAAETFDKEKLDKYEKVMKICDGMIVSTEFLADKYRSFNKNIYVCPNCVESARYAKLEAPKRDTCNIGWAGGVGHDTSVLPWIDAVGQVLEEHDDVRFVSIGADYANSLQPFFKSRAVAIPMTSLENFPTALLNCDIMMAPAGRSSFFKGKSNLRWLQAGALGIPCVADPSVYKEIEHGKTGMLASTPDEAQEAFNILVGDSELRKGIGHNAKEYIAKHHDIEVGREIWEKVFVDVSQSTAVA